MTWVPVGLVAMLALMSLGGGVYEVLVVDAAWPQRPDLVQPQQGGVSRRRFWMPAHGAFELTLIVTLVLAWGVPQVRHTAADRTRQPCGDADVVVRRLHPQGTRV